jgi:hypothetical protein
MIQAERSDVDDTTNNEHTRIMDKKAKAFICKNLEDRVLQGVLQNNFTTARGVWDYLHQRFDVRSRSEQGRTMQCF